jgi:hypothetical protein
MQQFLIVYTSKLSDSDVAQIWNKCSTPKIVGIKNSYFGAIHEGRQGVGIGCQTSAFLKRYQMMATWEDTK